MKDNETLSGARDAMGARGGFGRDRRAAFVPRMVDLRGETDEPSREAVRRILDASTRLQRLARPQRLFFDRFPHRPGRPPSVLRVRDLSGRNDLRFPELSRAAGGDAWRRAGEGDAARLRAANRDGGGVRPAGRPLHGFCNRVSVGSLMRGVSEMRSQMPVSLRESRDRRRDFGRARESSSPHRCHSTAAREHAAMDESASHVE